MSEVKKELIKRAEQIRHSTDILVAKTRDWQTIKQYLSNRNEQLVLTELQRKKLSRYQYIYNQLVGAKYTEHEVVNQVVKMFDVVLQQAYEDLSAAKEIYSTLFNINKRFELQMELQAARDLRRRCVELHDYKAAAAIQKNIIFILGEIPEIEDNPAEYFEGHDIEAVFDPTLLGAPAVNTKELLDAINAKRKVKIKTDLFIDIPYTDVKNEKETPL